MTLELRRLHPGTITPAELDALTAVFMAAPRYSLCVTGRLPLAEDALDLLHELPPGYAREDKHVFGVYFDGRMVGCADILKGWKHPGQSMIGLLLLAEDMQGKGMGRQALLRLEQCIAGWPGMRSVRIGVISTNTGALAFWRKAGFAATGESSTLAGYKGDVLIFEKPLQIGPA